MKTGMSLSALAAELERQSNAKRDFIASSQGLKMSEDGKTITLPGVDQFALSSHARGQLATKLEIPRAFYDRLEEKHPALLAHNVNQLFEREPKRSMIRTLDGIIRGWMSDRFRPLDNADLAEAVIPVLMESEALVESCDITPTKFYLKARMPWLDRELPVPAGLTMGVGHNWFPRRVEGALTISNSDVGAGALVIAPGTFEVSCTNLASYKDSGYGKTHIGKKANADMVDDPVSAYLSDGTKRLEDAAVWSKTRDMVKAAMDGRAIDAIIAKMTAARADVIEGDPTKIVEVFAKKYGVSEGEKGGLLRHLANAGEMSRYGLQWAVTRLAQDVDSYDRASDLERLGGQVIELAPSEWQVLTNAA